MSKLVVHGGVPLSGEVIVSGNKNAVLPMICGSLLTDAKVTLPDDHHEVAAFAALGADIEWVI